MRLRDDNAEVLEEYFVKAKEIFDSAQFIFGPEHNKFEDAFARKFKAVYAIGVASGTDALLLSLDALGIGSGDEVIIPAFTFIATADAVIRLGATPVLVDVSENDYNIDPEKIEEAITSHTKAIIPVHLYGKCAKMHEILKIAEAHELFVVEDAAQACGAKIDGKYAGTLGTTGCFSFYPTKTLAGAGDGGLITTNEDDIAQTLLKFRDHGRISGYTHDVIGYNSRLDTLQAALLALKLKTLDEKNRKRIENAAMYNRLFEKVETIVTPEIGSDDSHVFGLYTIRVPNRDTLKAYLSEQTIGSAVYYPISLHLQPCLSFLGYQISDFPVSEKVSEEVISLPNFPGLTEEEISFVAEHVISFCEKG